MSRALRNHNPGNIRLSDERYMGEVRPSSDVAFKEFVDMNYGYRAIFIVLNTYRRRYGIDTIAGMITRWAPPSENDTEGYIEWVSTRARIEGDRAINTMHRETMIPIVEAIATMESGEQPDPDEVAHGWRLFIESQL